MADDDIDDDGKEVLDYILGINDDEGTKDEAQTDEMAGVPSWMRNHADPLGLGLLPSDDEINKSDQADTKADKDILDIIPKTKDEVR